MILVEKVWTSMEKLRQAEHEVMVAIREALPTGTIVRYVIKSGAREQIGEVVDHVGGVEARVKVKLAPARWHRPGERLTVLSMPFVKIRHIERGAASRK